MQQYEYCIVFLDRVGLREGSGVAKLNELGADGWRVVHVREDPQHNHNLAFFMTRDKPV